MSLAVLRRCRLCAPRASGGGFSSSNIAAAACSRRFSDKARSADYWPDGTPKKFKGRDAWKNWIDFDSPYRSQTDELNRQRHYFWHVDGRGRLWRKELHRLDSHEGQMKDSRTLDFFFGHMQRNVTGLHAEVFPYISFRMHEHYFTSCTDAPVVFNDVRDGELRHICPDGGVARSISTRLFPSELRLTDEGKLYHPVVTKAVDEPTGPPRRESLMALVESTTAQLLLEHCEERDGRADADSSRPELVLRWDGVDTVLQWWDPHARSD